MPAPERAAAASLSFGHSFVTHQLTTWNIRHPRAHRSTRNVAYWSVGTRPVSPPPLLYHCTVPASRAAIPRDTTGFGVKGSANGVTVKGLGFRV